MKISGPGQGPGAPPSDAASAPDAAKTDGSMPADSVQGETFETFADKLEAGRAAQAQAAGPTLSPAIERVLDQVVGSQLAADAPPALRESLRAALRETLENDPFLAEKLRRLQET